MSNAFSSDRRGEVEATAPDLSANALLAAGIVVAALYFARDVLIPFVVAVLLSFVLAIPARVLQRWGLGRVFPVVLVVLLAFLAISAVFMVVASQAADLAAELPRYQTTIRDKIAALREAAGESGLVERLVAMLQTLSDEISGKRSGTGLPGTGEAGPAPIPVEVTNQRESALATLNQFVAPIVHPLAVAGLVVVFTVFILLGRGDLRNRAIRLAGSRDLQRTTAAMNDAATRLSRFFLVQVLLNVTFGVVIGLGLWLIGVPSPVLWGILAGISRFIPYVGVVLAAGGPLVLAAAVDPHWTMLGFTAAFFFCAEFLLGQIVEPLVYGHSTGLSPVAVIAAVTFWTWLWGPVGLLLATPLTVCLVVLGRHVDRLEFLDVMLGDRPPLTLAESFYQRLLAGDAGEATEQAELFLQDHALATFYDHVALKGLALAQADLSRGVLDDGGVARITATVAEVAVLLDEQEREVLAAPGTATRVVPRAAGDEDLDPVLVRADDEARDLPILDPAVLAPGWRSEAAVLCVAGRNAVDAAAAALLAQLLRTHGLGARLESADALAAAQAGERLSPDTRIVCLSYLDLASPARARHAVRRIRRRLPDATVVVCLWAADEDRAKAVCEASHSSYCASRLMEAARFCLDRALNPSEGGPGEAVSGEAVSASSGSLPLEPAALAEPA